MTSPLSSTERTRHRRLREQGRTDRNDLRKVLAAGLVAHLGVLNDGWPMVVPTSYGFDESTLYLHGSVASVSLRADSPVCVTITVADGLVLARSVFEHAVNYRCAMVYGYPRVVTGPDEVLAGLRLLSEHMAPGQWDYARRPNCRSWRRGSDPFPTPRCRLTSPSRRISPRGPARSRAPAYEVPGSGRRPSPAGASSSSGPGRSVPAGPAAIGMSARPA